MRYSVFRDGYATILVRRLRWPVLGTFGLVVVMIVAGVIYALYRDSRAPTLPAIKTGQHLEVQPFQPHKPGPDIQESAAVQGITSPIRPGEETSLNVRTVPTSSCTIAIGYKGAPASSKFIHATADAYGGVAWNWTVATTAPVGQWPIGVTCWYGQKSAVVDTTLVIAR